MTKILIVEDSKTYNNTLFALLRHPDYEILQAFTLKEALQKVEENADIDYIILDLILPDGEGDELILQFSSQKEKHPKIIVLSGNQDIQRRNYLFEHGVVDYFSKDIPLKTLIKDINKLIIDLSNNKNKNILIIDDSTFVRKTIRNILEMKNYTIFESKDGIAGIEHLEKGSLVNLILLDLEMPNLSGIEVLEKIKNNPKLEDIPIIIISSSEDKQKYSHVIKHGAVDFIRKPFSAEEILLKADLHIKQGEYLTKIASQAKELEEYKRVLNDSDMVSKTNPSGVIKEANDKFCKISGYSLEYLLGKSHRVVRHPDMPKKIFEDMWGKIKAHKTFKVF